MPPCPITVTILTKNEAALIERCVASVRWADEVLVLDSGSTDGTTALARALGASVYEQSWLGWVGQHERAVALARNDWVLVLDADEIVGSHLAASIQQAKASAPDPKDGYVVARRDEFFGKLFPNMQRAALRNNFVRLFNRTSSRYDPAAIVHERVVVPGRSIRLDGILIHWRNFRLVDQVERYVHSAPLEATVMAARGVRAGAGRIVLMPVLRFFWCYVRFGGWRLGTAGLVQAMLSAQSEFMRNAALWEKQSVAPQMHPPADLYDRPKARVGPDVAGNERVSSA